MSKFNTAINNKTINYASGEAFTESPKLAFLSLLLTSFVKDQYYRDADEGINQVRALIDQIPDKRFLAKAAIYTRTKFGMRSISHVVAGELASRIKGEAWLKDFINKVVYRPDDITEILSYYKSISGKKQSHAMRKGIAKALSRFDDYKLAKYKGDGKEVSLVDAVNLTHPKHTESLEKLIKGTLPTPETWETKLTATKGDEELKKEVWLSLIKERKIGYFALLRNLRNIIEQAPEIVPQAIELLTDENMIKKSLVLPFRFLTAIEEIQKLNGQGVREVLGGLNIALDKAVVNVPKFDGSTLIALDVSGSMSGDPAKIGSLFAAVLYKSNNADLIIFSDSAQYKTLNPLDSTLTLAQSIRFASGGTNFHAIFQEANKAYDRIIILSDMQSWIGYNVPISSFVQYKTRIGGNPFIYSFDLAGYGSLQFPEQNIFCIAGFSEKIFDVMKLLEQDRNALLTEIEKVEL